MPSKSPRFAARFAPRAALVICAGLVSLACCSRSAARRDASAAPPDAAVALGPGPWGALRVIGHVLEPPPAMVDNHCDREPSSWRFRGLRRDAIEQLLVEGGLPEADLRALLDTARCDAAGCTLAPSIDQVTRMDATARGVIYARLASIPEDASLLPLFKRRAQDTDLWNGPGVPAAARAIVEERSFRVGDVVMFLDLPLLCRALDEAEGARTAKTATLRALSRVPSLIMQLHVGPESDLAGLAAYWGAGGREAEVRPLLESIARVPGGTWVDVMHLLPKTARTRLYRYPEETDPARDCHWTAFNFFRDPPDDALMDPARVNATLSAEYEDAGGEPPRLGDVLLFVRKEDDTLWYLHSAVYVADDVVFTKNGRSARRPWELMHLADVRATYHAATDVLRVRRRSPLVTARTIGATTSGAH